MMTRRPKLRVLVSPGAGPDLQVAPWSVLEQALLERRPVVADYHGRIRVLCPHLLGWTDSRPLALCYQIAAGSDSTGWDLQADPGWRIMLIEQLEDPLLIAWPWQTAADYRPQHPSIRNVALAIDLSPVPAPTRRLTLVR